MNVDWGQVGEVVRWMVTTVAALGTPIIAYLVYKLNKNNSEFSKLEAARANAVELNKIKLSLLDRRIDFIQRFEQIYNAYLSNDQGLSDFAGGVEDLMDLSKAIFREPVQEELASLWNLAHKSNQLARKTERLTDLEDPKAEQTAADLHASLDAFYAARAGLMVEMYDQTRIDIFDAREP